jgi:hypothetical protein
LIQPIRKFDVEVIHSDDTDGDFAPGQLYPVLALDKEGDDLYLLLADGDGDLAWVPWTAVRVAQIE